jgi:hypothetical protein
MWLPCGITLDNVGYPQDTYGHFRGEIAASPFAKSVRALTFQV